MSAASIGRFRDGIERCLRKAASASNKDTASLWLFNADGYRFLLQLEQRDQERGTWEWNVTTTMGRG